MPGLRSVEHRASTAGRGASAWLRLSLGKHELTVSSRSQAPLSPHLLNLRPGLVPPPSSPSVPPPPRVGGALRGVDFLSHLTPSFALPLRPGASWLEHHPKWRLLSLYTLLEFGWLVAAIIWNGVVYVYFQLANEAYALGRAVGQDLAEFGHAVALVFSVPFRLVVPQTVAVTVTRRRLVWQPSAQVSFFFVMALIVTLPLKGIATWAEVKAREGSVTDLAAQAVGNLRAGSASLSSGNPGLAELDFKRASQTFSQALSLLGGLPDQVLGLLDKLPGTPQRLVAANHLLQASQAVSQAAATAARTWAQVVDSSATQPTDLGAQVAALQLGLQNLKPELDHAIAELKAVDASSLPPALGGSIASLQNQLDQLEGLVAQAFTLPSFLSQVVASKAPKRYVVLFQNSSELRPTGGFMGSLALIELASGKVSQVQIPGGGPYDFQGSLHQVIRPPEPLRLARGTWQLQDANWFFDFPTTAHKVLWFLKASGGPDAQGVVALTPDLVLKLLQLTGPLSMPQYHLTLTADNFMRETQLQVEVTYDHAANRPKQFIADVAQSLMQRLIDVNESSRVQLLALVEQGIAQRSLQVYLTEPELQANVLAYGWGGEVRQVPLDYLALVRTNIGGGKTDAVTDEQLRHEVEVQPDGKLIARLEFTRQHQGSSADLFEQRRNTDYLRFYVPEGSTLLTADGFTPPPAVDFKPVPEGATLDQDLVSVEQQPVQDQSTSGLRVTTEFGKTVFAGWVAVAPGESQTVHLSYQLPFTLQQESTFQDLRRYSVYFQRQAGVRPMDFTSTLKLPENWRVRWQESSATLVPQPDGLQFTSDWSQDEYYGSVLERLAG